MIFFLWRGIQDFISGQVHGVIAWQFLKHGLVDVVRSSIGRRYHCASSVELCQRPYRGSATWHARLVQTCKVEGGKSLIHPLQQAGFVPLSRREAVRQAYAARVQAWKVFGEDAVVEASVRAVADIEHELCPVFALSCAQVEGELQLENGVGAPQFPALESVFAHCVIVHSPQHWRYLAKVTSQKHSLAAKRSVHAGEVSQTAVHSLEGRTRCSGCLVPEKDVCASQQLCQRTRWVHVGACIIERDRYAKLEA